MRATLIIREAKPRDATELASQEAAERVEGVGVPPARDLLRKLRDNEVPVYV